MTQISLNLRPSVSATVLSELQLKLDCFCTDLFQHRNRPTGSEIVSILQESLRLENKETAEDLCIRLERARGKITNLSDPSYKKNGQYAAERTHTLEALKKFLSEVRPPREWNPTPIEKELNAKIIGLLTNPNPTTFETLKSYLEQPKRTWFATNIATLTHRVGTYARRSKCFSKFAELLPLIADKLELCPNRLEPRHISSVICGLQGVNTKHLSSDSEPALARILTRLSDAMNGNTLTSDEIGNLALGLTGLNPKLINESGRLSLARLLVVLSDKIRESPLTNNAVKNLKFGLRDILVNTEPLTGPAIDALTVAINNCETRRGG